VSNESHFSTSGGKRRDKKRMKQKLKFLEQWLIHIQGINFTAETLTAN
jgi:hypothetical protein